MKHKNLITTMSVIAFFLIFSIWAWIKPSDNVSASERRKLLQPPKLTMNTILSGNFMTDFEKYTLDQFPMRESFRNIKAIAELYVFCKSDNNDLYMHDGYISQTQYSMNNQSIEYAASRFKYVYDKYLTKSNVYVSIIPDKNYFMAKPSGHLSFNYDEFINVFTQNMSFARYIDIVPNLSLTDYYKADTHWRQENIVDVANTLLTSMGATSYANYTIHELMNEFFGVYYGQLALPIEPETISYLSSDVFEDCVIYDYEHDAEIPMYDLNKVNSNDPYEIFLSGPLSLVTITNPHAGTNKELVLFRDSFGSSIAPLFVQSYNKVTLVDIRYITPNMLDKYVDFENADVLFLYSTLVLNNSEVIK